jgi:hypothetical protein
MACSEFQHKLDEQVRDAKADNVGNTLLKIYRQPQ